MRTIGVFQTWGLGDLVMTVPVLSELRRLYPNARVILMVRGGAQASLLAGSQLVDEIVSVPNASDRLQVLGFFWSLRRYHFDAVFVATRITPVVPALLRLVSGVGAIIGDGTQYAFLYTVHNKIDRPEHRVDRMLATLAKWTGVPVAQPQFDLALSDEARASVSELLTGAGINGRSFIAIHPGSSAGPGKVKRLPVTLVHSVIAAARRDHADLCFVLLFGPDDQDLVQEFASVGEGVALVTDRSLDEIKMVLAQSVGFIGSDSALAHLAAAFRVPTVVAFGPTDADETKPYGPLARKVVSDEVLACRPCWSTPLYGNCPYDRRCLTGIATNRVLATMADWRLGPR